METRIIEATNGFNWGKFILMRPDAEWSYRSQIDTVRGVGLLQAIGWGHQHLIVFDLQTNEGASYRVAPDGLPAADLRKHKILVCPMYEPFLEWLYRQDVSDLTTLPAVVNLDPEATAKHTAMWGYRRPGEEEAVA